MHEMSIASQLLQQVLSSLTGHDVTRVDEVEVKIGLLRQIVPEALQTAWEAVAEGSAAQGAVLKIVEVAPTAKCCLCGRTFDVTVDDFTCGQCEAADIEIVAGNDIDLLVVQNLMLTFDSNLNPPFFSGGGGGGGTMATQALRVTFWQGHP